MRPGQGLLLGFCGSYLALELGALLVWFAEFSQENVFTTVMRVSMAGGLFAAAHSGANWARLVCAGLLSMGLAIFGVALVWQPNLVTAAMMGYMAAFFWALVFSSSVKRFVADQRERRGG